MKPNATEMREARLEAIKILENPKCTEKDFEHLRPILNDNTITVRGLNLTPLSGDARLGGLYLYVWYCYNNDTHNYYVGTIADIASQMNITYNRLYSAMSNNQPSALNIEYYPIDVIPVFYNKKTVVVYNADHHVMYKGTYGNVCKMLDIHTSDLWELIENKQTHRSFLFEVGEGDV